MRGGACPPRPEYQIPLRINLYFTAATAGEDGAAASAGGAAGFSAGAETLSDSLGALPGNVTTLYTGGLMLHMLRKPFLSEMK